MYYNKPYEDRRRADYLERQSSHHYQQREMKMLKNLSDYETDTVVRVNKRRPSVNSFSSDSSYASSRNSNNSTRSNSKTRGWDRSYPLQPVTSNNRRSNKDSNFNNQERRRNVQNQDRTRRARSVGYGEPRNGRQNHGGRRRSSSLIAGESKGSTQRNRINGRKKASQGQNNLNGRGKSQANQRSVNLQPNYLDPDSRAKSSSATQRSFSVASLRPPSIMPRPLSSNKPASAISRGPTPPGLKSCKNCGRHFDPDRWETHEPICLKSTKALEKRKVFDSVQNRIKGTEAEQTGKRSNKRKTNVETKSKKDWRAKREEFVSAIRAAKHAQRHLANGGDIKDLPPPPPSDYSDYIQCPHCGRKFNESAASRHIPKCKDIKSNKR